MSRLLLPFDTGALAAPDGPVLYLNAQADEACAHFADTTLQQDSFPVTERLPAGAAPLASGENYALCLVTMSRQRDQNRARIAQAWRRCAIGGHVVISGAKTDGADALIKELRRLIDLDGVLAKSHGKVFWIERGANTPAAFKDWEDLDKLTPNRDGYLTAPGMFGHAGIDSGSALLAANLPRKLGAHVVDLGAGWGFLSRKILENPDVERLDLVEASHAALDAARANVSDPRARFHWADATRFALPQTPAHSVISNPPFHESRSADPDLGRAFIATAARILRPSGRFYMVANRHLPYEAALDAAFRKVTRIADQNGYKVFAAENPHRRKG